MMTSTTESALFRTPYYVTFCLSSLRTPAFIQVLSLAGGVTSGGLSKSSISAITLNTTPNCSCHSPFSSTPSSLSVAHVTSGSSVSSAMTPNLKRSTHTQSTRGSVQPLGPTSRNFISSSREMTSPFLSLSSLALTYSLSGNHSLCFRVKCSFY
jgi:hypothetical protein